MLTQIKNHIASFASGIPAKQIPVAAAMIRNTTGYSSIIFHFDGTVSGVKNRNRTTLAMASDFA